jgi:hypothetical protein
MTPTPRKQILIDSQSSSLPGFLANCISLRAELRNDLKPMVAQPLNKHSLLIYKSHLFSFLVLIMVSMLAFSVMCSTLEIYC